MPQGTPQSVINKLHGDFAEVLQLPDIRSRMLEIGEEPGAGSPEQFRNFMNAEIGKFRRIVNETKLAVN